MARFALIIDNALVKLQDWPTNPDDIARKNVKFLPCDQVAPPSFDPNTETVEGPTYNIGATAVTETWTKRALTSQELSVLKDGKISSIDSLHFQIAFDIENRVRTLEGKATITMVQYRSALKAKLP